MYNYNSSCCLDECETRSLTLREEHRLRATGNRVLKNILVFGSERDKVTVGEKRLHNEGLRDGYCSLNIILVIKSRRLR